MKDAGSSIPSTGALLAFEATARLGSVVRAAEELEVSSPAISRHISKLEDGLSVQLFERKGRGLTLTKCGKDYLVAVQSSIHSLRAAGNRLHAENTILTIGCTQGVSVKILLPLYPTLRRLLDGNVDLRILNCEYDMLPSLLPVGMDVFFEYSTVWPVQHSARLFDEEVVPVASPSFVERFKRELAEHPSQWFGLPRLESAQTGAVWASWETWFRSQNCQPPKAPVETHEDSLYLAEAAARGQGIALGWNGFTSDYFETGRLVPIRDEWVRTKASLYGILTATGQRNPIARRFLTELTGLAGEFTIGSDELKKVRERWVSRPPDVTLHQPAALERVRL